VAPGAKLAYSSLRRLRAMVAEGAATFGPCSLQGQDTTAMLRALYARVAVQARSAASGTLPRTRATRPWPSDEPRDVVSLFARAVVVAMDEVRVIECAAAQCAECGGATCASVHPLKGGQVLWIVWQAVAALSEAVAAARGAALEQGPVATRAEFRDVFVGSAGVAGATVDVLLAHLQRYVPVLQIFAATGPVYLQVVQLAVMLQVPLRRARDAPRWCAACTRLEVCMPAGEHARVCSKCECVRYCSRRCQTAHWRDGHKQYCAALAALKSGSVDGIGNGGDSAMLSTRGSVVCV
jgi:MYND finger